MTKTFTLGPLGDDAVEKMIREFCEDRDMLKNLMYMAQGNPGAVTAMRCMFEVDPAATAFALGKAAAFEIKGPMLWLLFKDVCSQNALTCIKLLCNDTQAPEALAGLHYSRYKWPK